MCKSFDLLANAYKINAFVINALKNKWIYLNAQIDLIYSQMHIKLIHLFKCAIRFDLVVNTYVTQPYRIVLNVLQITLFRHIWSLNHRVTGLRWTGLK